MQSVTSYRTSNEQWATMNTKATVVLQCYAHNSEKVFGNFRQWVREDRKVLDLSVKLWRVPKSNSLVHAEPSLQKQKWRYLEMKGFLYQGGRQFLNSRQTNNTREDSQEWMTSHQPPFRKETFSCWCHSGEFIAGDLSQMNTTAPTQRTHQFEDDTSNYPDN